jgi:hypothetical protein
MRRDNARVMSARQAQPRVVLAATVVAAFGAVAWLLWHPPVADLAAQQARAQLAEAHGFTPYSFAWFGGFDLPTYSVWVPWLMGATSVYVVGAVATV